MGAGTKILGIALALSLLLNIFGFLLVVGWVDESNKLTGRIAELVEWKSIYNLESGRISPVAEFNESINLTELEVRPEALRELEKLWKENLPNEYTACLPYTVTNEITTRLANGSFHITPYRYIVSSVYTVPFSSTEKNVLSKERCPDMSFRIHSHPNGSCRLSANDLFAWGNDYGVNTNHQRLYEFLHCGQNEYAVFHWS